mmetsp:Transcript_5676/g.6296  ORF Transcript_5676/g.6296 Transcript_5676/m.6296 type:complete len:117 (-) Transcript_5676:358-708(-)
MTRSIGGALSFKGDKKKLKKRSKKTKKSIDKMNEERDYHDTIENIPAESVPYDNDDDDELTEAERKALKFKKQRQKEDSEKIAQKSHRQRVEELNEKLGSMTELNDIPRVSAAGNG